MGVGRVEWTPAGSEINRRPSEDAIVLLLTAGGARFAIRFPPATRRGVGLKKARINSTELVCKILRHTVSYPIIFMRGLNSKPNSCQAARKRCCRGGPRVYNPPRPIQRERRPHAALSLLETP